MNSHINILFFAALAEQLDCQKETLELPISVVTTGDLQHFLSNRKGKWSALTNTNIRCAVNQDIVKTEHSIKAGDEIAFFPPVTGG